MQTLKDHSSLAFAIQLTFAWDEKAAHLGGFFTSDRVKDMASSGPKIPRKTAVYVDGYNLYYGRLRGTPFKWLDVVKLFERLLVQRDQNETLLRVNFFTAPALATFATHKNASVAAQSAYLRALKTLYGSRIEFFYGTHSFDRSGSLLPTYISGKPFDRTNRTRVWKIEEKKTDVNLALCIYRDACKALYDRIVLVSNDSDAEPVLEAIRQDFPNIMIGVVMPVRPPAAGPAKRRTSGSLIRQSDWAVTHMTDEQLQEAQLPNPVATGKKPIRKPEYW